MTARGHARILIWEGASLWLVDVASGAHATDFHSHHAVQLALSLGGLIEIATAAGSLAGDVAIAADERHLMTSSGRIAVLFVEPESRAGRAITAAYFANAKIALVPRAAIGDLLDRLDDKDDAVLLASARALIDRLAGTTRPEVIDWRVRRMIAAAAGGPVTLAVAARAAGLSPGRARHLFVEQTGLPFRTYLLWRRITAAVEAMAAGATLTAAAMTAGFADSAHFSRTFRRMFGITAAALQISPFIQAPPDRTP